MTFKFKNPKSTNSNFNIGTIQNKQLERHKIGIIKMQLWNQYYARCRT